MWKEQKGKREAKNDMDRSYKERHGLFIGKWDMALDRAEWQKDPCSGPQLSLVLSLRLYTFKFHTLL